MTIPQPNTPKDAFTDIVANAARILLVTGKENLHAGNGRGSSGRARVSAYFSNTKLSSGLHFEANIFERDSNEGPTYGGGALGIYTYEKKQSPYTYEKKQSPVYLLGATFNDLAETPRDMLEKLAKGDTAITLHEGHGHIMTAPWVETVSQLARALSAASALTAKTATTPLLPTYWHPT